MPYALEFRVKGSGYFPTDMLRYSNCQARSSDDQASVDTRPREWPGVREVELVRVASNSFAAKFLAEGRWKSFGWEVIRVSKPFRVTPEWVRSTAPNCLKQLGLKPAN